MGVQVPGDQGNGLLEEIFDIVAAGQKGGQFADIAEQVEMIGFFSVWSLSLRGFPW